MSGSHFVEVEAGARTLRIEHRWAGDPAAAPLLVFLHEGLGSVSMWRDFPDRLCAAAGCRALVWSRPGYGRSTPRASGERWPPSYMHHQALEVLPALLRALAVATPPWLLGHSDGASIALLHAARFAVAGCVVMAPHLFVEPVSLASIEQARRAYLDSDLRERLARYHDDPDSAFWGWNDIWLAPAFRDWNIEAEIAGIGAPLLAIQGLDDEYGTLAQIHAVARRVPQTELLELPDCGHSPHRDQPDAVIGAVTGFLRRHRG
jgi:pimeloyl-ACP methyl ester carboxylesterase